jgi:hypothetical protein
MVSVPLYDSLGADARAFVMAQCDMRVRKLRQNFVTLKGQSHKNVGAIRP